MRKPYKALLNYYVYLRLVAILRAVKEACVPLKPIFVDYFLVTELTKTHPFILPFHFFHKLSLSQSSIVRVVGY